MKKINPLWIDIPEELLKDLLSEGVQNILGYKLCRHAADYDVDTGETTFKIRVCEGPTGIPCQCLAISQIATESKEEELPVHINEIYREEDF